MSNANADKRKAARGALPWQEGDEPAEATIRRIRGGDTERIAALEAELARVRRVAVAALKDAVLNPYQFMSAALTELDNRHGADILRHNDAIFAAIAEIGGNGDD